MSESNYPSQNNPYAGLSAAQYDLSQAQAAAQTQAMYQRPAKNTEVVATAIIIRRVGNGWIVSQDSGYAGLINTPMLVAGTVGKLTELVQEWAEKSDPS